MKPCKTEQEYLDQIIEPVRRCCKRYGYLPSILIAQSALENGYGIPSYWDNPQVRALINANNGVGIKRKLLNESWVDCGKSVWQGQYLRKNTPEQYGNEMITIKDDFRVYDCMERSFADYLCFMTWGSNYGAGGNPKYGPKVLSIKDPETLIRTVSSLGYASGQTYPTSVMRIVKRHNLTKYDDLSRVEPTIYYPASEAKMASDIKIIPNKNFEPTHNTSSRPCAIEFIYIHYVGALGGAKANVDYYNQRSTTEASADFYVDFDGSIYQYNMQLQNRYCWAVGGGRQSGYGGKFYGIAKNANGISIEMCVRSRTGRAPAGPNDKNWYFEQATIDGAVKLAKHLMKEYRIPADHVIRHFDVNGKFCPGVVGWNDASGSNTNWNKFKSKLVAEVAKNSTTTNTTTKQEEKPVTQNVIYRVQVSKKKHKKISTAQKRAATVKAKSGFDCFIEQMSDKTYSVFCGSFSSEANAKNRVKELNARHVKIAFVVMKMW